MLRRVLPIVLVTAGCYAHLFTSPSVRFVFDDERFVLKNVAVHDLSNFGRYFTDPTTVDPHAWTGIYRPLRTVDFALDWAIAGASPRWFHLRNVVYHLLGALLVLALLRRWGAGETGATLGALVFAVHPVQAEAVAWITSRGDLLCLVFFLLALLLHQRSRGSDRYFLGATAVLALALLSKEVAVMFPAAAFLADLFFRDERRLRRTLRRWRQYLVYAVAAGLYVGLWTWMHAARDVDGWHLPVRWGDSFAGTLLTMARGFVYYLRLVVLPVDMAQDFYVLSVKSPDPLTVLCAAVIVALLGYAVYRLFRGGGAVAFAVLWFVIAIFPASNIPAPIGIVTAERFLYLPMVGLALPAGVLLGRAWARGVAGRTLTVAILLCLGAVTFERTFDWASVRALWTTSLRRFESPRALEWKAEGLRERAASLKVEVQRLGDRGEEEAAQRLEARAEDLLEDSVRTYDQAIAFWRQLPDPGLTISVLRASRAHAYFLQGKHELALREADEVLETPVYQLMGRAHLVQGLALHKMGDHRGAAQAVEVALEFEDNEAYRKKAAAIYQDLARWYNEPGRENRARTYATLKRAWSLYPSEVENAGVYEALTALEEEFATEAPPLRKAAAQARGTTSPEVYINLAVLYAQFGYDEPAGRLFEQLMSPDQLDRDPRVLLPYARYVWEARDTFEGYDEAERIYREILAEHPDFAGVEEALARVERERTLLEESRAR